MGRSIDHGPLRERSIGSGNRTGPAALCKHARTLYVRLNRLDARRNDLNLVPARHETFVNALLTQRTADVAGRRQQTAGPVL